MIQLSGMILVLLLLSTESKFLNRKYFTQEKLKIEYIFKNKAKQNKNIHFYKVWKYLITPGKPVWINALIFRFLMNTITRILEWEIFCSSFIIFLQEVAWGLSIKIQNILINKFYKYSMFLIKKPVFKLKNCFSNNNLPLMLIYVTHFCLNFLLFLQ